MRRTVLFLTLSMLLGGKVFGGHGRSQVEVAACFVGLVVMWGVMMIYTICLMGLIFDALGITESMDREVPLGLSHVPLVVWIVGYPPYCVATWFVSRALHRATPAKWRQ